MAHRELCTCNESSMKENTINEPMEKYSTYHIETSGFEKILIGVFHMIQTVPLGSKCRIVLDYDPALPKVTIETFIDKSDTVGVPERRSQWVPYDPMPQ